MKNIIILIICVFFISARSIAQFIQIPTGTTSMLNKISIIGSNIVVNGRSNYIARSYDSCTTLQPLTVAGPAGYSNYLSRVDTNNLYIFSTGGTDNKVFKSSDGGMSWTQKFDTTGVIYTHIAFFDSLEGVVLGASNKMSRTKNGGNTWTSNNASPFAVTTAIKTFGDSLVCLGGVDSGGGSLFYLSKDRGNTWIIGINFGILSDPRDFYFLDKDTIFAVSTQGYFGAYFAKTYNGGASWQKSNIPLNNAYAIHFRSASEGYIVGRDDNDNYGTILKTLDSGQTWITYKTPFKTILLAIDFINDSMAILTGSGGELLKWNKNSLITSIKNNDFDDLSIKFFPNPVKDKLNLEFSNASLKDLQLCIQNSIGQVVYEQKVNSLKQEIDLRQYASGIYFLKVQNNNSQRVFKLVKE